MNGGVNFRLGQQGVVALVVIRRLTQTLPLLERKPMRGIGADVGIVVRFVVELIEHVDRVFRRAEVETVIAEPSTQAIDSPADLGGRLGRSGNVKRPAFVTELELDIAGVRHDVAEQQLRRRIVGVRRQSDRLGVSGRVAQQFARIGRIDRGERSGGPSPVEELFHLVFIEFTEHRVLDAETIGVHQKAAQRDVARAGPATQEHHPHAGLEYAILHEAGVQGMSRGPTDLMGQSAAGALGLEPMALFQDFLSLGSLRMFALSVYRGHGATPCGQRGNPWPSAAGYCFP